jgi:hypothetical protein
MPSNKPSRAYLLLPMDSIACHGGPMKVNPASVHFANVGFSLNCIIVSTLEWPTSSQGTVQIHSQDVCPGSPAPGQFLLSDRHQDRRKRLQDSQRTGSSERAASGHLGPCRGLLFGCHIPTRFGRLVLGVKLAEWHRIFQSLSYRAISPRFAMRTEVSGLATGAVVEV